MKRRLLTPFAGIFLLVLAACSVQNNNQPAEIKSLSTYTDPVYSFTIKYPENWATRKVAGEQFMAISSDAALNRFVKFDPEGDAGARIQVLAIKTDGKPMDQIMSDQRMFEEKVYQAPQDVTIGGVAGKKISYGFDLNDGAFKGEKYFAARDSGLVTVVTFEAFGGTFDAYRANFDEILKSVQPATAPVPVTAKTDTIKTPSEPQPPSDTLRAYNGDGFSMEVPQNFISGRGQTKGALSSVFFMGDQRENTIQVDVLDASKQSDLSKIVESNKATYQAQSSTPTKIGGENAAYMNYSVRGDVGSRVYFTVHNGKLYRITLNWLKPAESKVRPIFEKSVNSFRFK